MKKIYESLFLLLFLTPLAMTSCDDGGEEIVDLKYEGRNITVTGINPPSGYAGETLEILGKDFGVSPEQAKVFIGNTSVKIVSYEDTKIIVEVPTQGTRGKVAVEILGNKVVSELVYDVLGNLGVESIEPPYGFIGDQIVFKGHDFGTVASLVKVRFAGTEEDTEVYECQNEKILVVVPKDAVTGPIKLQISKQEDINMPEDFTVLAHADFDELPWKSGYRGSRITLKGKNFVGKMANGAVGGTDGIKVFFEKIEAQIVSCTDTEIVVIVPESVEEGENVISIETPYEKVSMTRKFTILPTPTINKISATEGYVGAVITFTGENLPMEGDHIEVMFGESKAEVVSSSETELKVKVPAPAGNFGEMLMTLTISGLQIDSRTFTINETPVITSITSGKLVKIGSVVVISGERLEKVALEKVTIGGIEATVNSKSDTEIEVIVPEGFKSGKVALTFEGIPLDVESDTELVLISAGENITDYVLQNYREPIKGTGSGEWQLPAVWKMNEVVKGAVVGMQGTVISFQRGWGKNTWLHNAKMWQVAQLPAGKYKLQAVCSATNVSNKDAAKNFAYILVAKGAGETDIPNRDQIESSSNCAFNVGGRPQVGNLETTVLELTEASEVLIGFLIEIDADQCYFKVTDMTLTCVE